MTDVELNPDTIQKIVRDMVRLLDIYEGRAPLLSNQGQALDGYSALANFVAIAQRARAIEQNK